ncbi:MAG: MFS transporter, partial [Proteobacteria bacterium]|nr:MFS transporter [Pseudomonadota bacterium]
ALAFGGIQSFAPAALSTIYSIPHTMAIAGITTYMLASAIGLLIGGFIASMTGRHDLVIMLALFIAGATAIITGLGLFQGWSVILLLGIIGLGAGVAGPSRDMLVRAASPKGSTGRVYGVVYSGLDIGLAIAPLIFGLLMDSNLSIWVFFLIGLFQFTAILAAIEVRHQRLVTA